MIAGRIPGRTANAVNNYWNTHLRKKVAFSHENKDTKNNSIKDKKVINNNNNKSNVNNIIVKPRPRIFRKQPTLMDKNNTTTTNLYSINENIRPTSTDNHHEEAAGVVSVNKSRWESLLLVDDSMISTNTSEDGIFPNYIASCTSTGNLDLHADPSSN